MAGPLQVIAVGFGPGVGVEGRVLAEVGRLQGRGVLRLLDVLVVAKNEDGTVRWLAADDEEDSGALLARIVPADGAGLAGPPAGGGVAGFDPDDARELAESMLPGTSVAFLLVEHGWAQPLFDAIAETGGSLLAEGFLTAEAGVLAGAEVAAWEEAARGIAAAQAAEARAALVALAAADQAAEAVATAGAIRAAAAAGAVQALITAGLVEEAAAHEAVEALAAAGIIAEAAAEAVTEGAATARAASVSLAEARVLRYLPTQLTFAMIAGKLGISRSAAKERAERAYKKLGVHSRAEAVSRARTLGLID
jgi:DNA-binding NarL/FixJ family response regulator/uncharacterized membrane protein